MDIVTTINRLADDIGRSIVLYVDDCNGGRQLLDELSAERGRNRKAVHLNLVLLFAWAAMRKASQLLGEHPPAVQLFTDRMCETVYSQLGKTTAQIEPLLHDRWAIFSDCGIDEGPEGLQQLGKAFDACCGDTIADPDHTRTYSLNLLLHVRIATEFAAFFSSIDGPFVDALT